MGKKHMDEKQKVTVEKQRVEDELQKALDAMKFVQLEIAHMREENLETNVNLLKATEKNIKCEDENKRLSGRINDLGKSGEDKDQSIYSLRAHDEKLLNTNEFISKENAKYVETIEKKEKIIESK